MHVRIMEQFKPITNVGLSTSTKREIKLLQGHLTLMFTSVSVVANIVDAKCHTFFFLMNK